MKYEGDPYQEEMEATMKELLTIVKDKKVEVKDRIAAAHEMDHVAFHVLQADTIRDIHREHSEKHDDVTDQIKRLKDGRTDSEES